jgi:hypothetical protein
MNKFGRFGSTAGAARFGGQQNRQQIKPHSQEAAQTNFRFFLSLCEKGERAVTYTARTYVQQGVFEAGQQPQYPGDYISSIISVV